MEYRTSTHLASPLLASPRTTTPKMSLPSITPPQPHKTSSILIIIKITYIKTTPNHTSQCSAQPRRTKQNPTLYLVTSIWRVFHDPPVYFVFFSSCYSHCLTLHHTTDPCPAQPHPAQPYPYLRTYERSLFPWSILT